MDFDGTQDPNQSAGTESAAGTSEPETSNQPEARKTRPERQGMKYSTMDARYKKTHLCDHSRLPEGSVIISTEMRKVFDRVCYVVGHDFPMEGDGEQVRCIPGTHATADLLSNLACNILP